MTEKHAGGRNGDTQIRRGHAPPRDPSRHTARNGARPLTARRPAACAYRHWCGCPPPRGRSNAARGSSVGEPGGRGAGCGGDREAPRNQETPFRRPRIPTLTRPPCYAGIDPTSTGVLRATGGRGIYRCGCLKLKGGGR
eukprot:gene6387-24481_t